ESGSGRQQGHVRPPRTSVVVRTLHQGNAKEGNRRLRESLRTSLQRTGIGSYFKSRVASRESPVASRQSAVVSVSSRLSLDGQRCRVSGGSVNPHGQAQIAPAARR